MNRYGAESWRTSGGEISEGQPLLPWLILDHNGQKLWATGPLSSRQSVNEIEQAWEDHSLHRGLMEACGKIKYPVFLSSCITSGKEWKSIAKVGFERGGAFIHDIEDKFIPGVLELLAAFVDCHSSGKSGIDCPQWMKDKGILDVIPSMFVKLAGMMREGTGYRLLR